MAKVKNPVEGKLSSRINLALPAKLAEDLKTLAFLDGTSVNDYVKRIITAYVEACADDLKKYQKFREQIQKEKMTSKHFVVYDDDLKIGYARFPRVAEKSASDDELSTE